MTSSDRAALRQYYRSVRTSLSNCPRKQRVCVLNDLKSNISAFLDTEPQADFQKVQAHFGTPQQIASGYLGDLTDAELLNAVKKRKIWTVVIGLFVAAFVIWLLAVGWAIIHEQVVSNGTATSSPIIEITP